ncbi:glycosyltransferase [Streptomyces sp. MW-W600-10]|uniref:glycosyltransferase n=1 Tax=Streptomyces sp. MW-W600-10 TaxID=2829819 RepID=UPI001C44A4D0|nr:glycosyltransferase [Streptomyces sp. MW-W600-10]MBV7245841.1 glycosyltransferase family 1 protein [Streptomyces sp. MW-W600-10]
MRVLLAATPGAGHVMPLIPILNAFRAAGHDVAFAISDEIVVPGLDSSVRCFTKAAPRFPVCPYPHGPERTAWWVRVNTEMAWASYLSTLEIIEEFKPDIIVRDSAERGAYLAAEVLGIPHVNVLVGAESVLKPYIERERLISEPLRKSLGLPEDPSGSTQIPLGIALTHPRFFGGRADLHPYSTFYCVDPPAEPRETDTGRPSVLVSLGSSMAVPHTRFAHRILTGPLRDDVRITVAVPDHLRHELVKEFPRADILGFDDLSPHLEHADVVVSHGGFGTVRAALHRGIPMHITPFWSDQFLNAECITECGAGLALPWDSCSPQELAESVLRVVRESTFRNAAHAFSEDAHALPGAEECVRDITSII